MSETRAVTSEWLARSSRGTATTGRPLCPSCVGGYLHPFRVEIGLGAELGGWGGVGSLVGWVAVCRGNDEERENRRRLYVEAGETPPDDDPAYGPCGFSMPMTPLADRRSAPVLAEPVALPAGESA